MGGAKPIPTPLSPRLVEAVAEAWRLHAGQARKGTWVPYLAHLLAVTALVLEDGGSEDEAIGALLHNARALLRDYRAVGERVFERFKTRSAADQLWYYRSLADLYRERLPGPMAEELARAVDELEAAVGTPAT